MDSPASDPQPPRAAARPVEVTTHGHTRVDEYDWLRIKDDPEVLAYLAAENAYTEHRTAGGAELREQIFEEIRSRTVETDMSVPTRMGQYWYYGRTFAGREYGASCRSPVSGPDDWAPPRPADCSIDQPALPGEEVLLDFNQLAADTDYFAVGGTALNADGSALAYAIDTVGHERYTVRFKALTSGAALDDTLTGVSGCGVWDRAGGCFYYATVDDAWRADTVWRHRLGTPQESDERVFHEADARFSVGVGRSRSNRFLVIASSSRTTSEYHFLDAENPDAEFVLFSPRREGLEYSLGHGVIGGEDVFLVLHNGSGPDFALSRSPLRPTSPEDWEPIIEHTPGCRLESVQAFAGHVVIDQRSSGLTQLRILQLGETGIDDDYLIDFDGDVYTVGSGANPEFSQPRVRLGYTSLAVPASVYDYDVSTRTRHLLRRTPVLGGFDPADYEEHRLWATAPDGEQVPISLVARRDRPPGPAPLLLYGYGAYEASIDPGFSVPRLSLLDRGVGYAIAHVRGGGEMGRRWYDDGKLMAKQHTFSDFIACARHLAEEGWTTPDRIVAEGASAGGLLMGAVANQAPDTFGGIVANVPFVDALTTMLDPNLPLTVTEYDEWGNPTDDVEAYHYILGYAPYDNVAARDYPPMLVLASYHDTRVLYVEPAKWVARLRDRATGRRDFLLKTEMQASHAGVSGRYHAWRDRAFTLAWVLERLLDHPESSPGMP